MSYLAHTRAEFESELTLHTRSFVTLCGSESCDAQVLLVMPDNARFDAMSHGELKSELSAQMRRKVLEAIRNGTKEFEIQLVQNIGGFGYADQRQHKSGCVGLDVPSMRRSVRSMQA